MTGTALIIMVLSGLCFLPYCLSRRYILIEKNNSWAAAQTYCRWKYTDLASVRNMEDFQELQKLLNGSEADAWIGLHADAESWKWSLEDKGHRGKEDAGYRKWREGEPDGSAYYKLCVRMGPHGQWSDDNCNTSYRFFCYSEGNNSKKASSSFVFVDEPKTWEEARNYCRTMYTDLAIVRNQEENDELGNMNQKRRTWIGLYRDSWTWSDGSAHSFSRWADSAPSTTFTDSCVISTSGKWLNKHCSKPFSFVCYYEASPVKMQVVRVVLKKKDSSVDMEDLKEDILQEFNKRLEDHNVDEGVKLKWVVQPDGKVFHKENKYKKGSWK